MKSDSKKNKNKKTSMRAQMRTECVLRREAEQLASEQHHHSGHMRQDGIKIALKNRITSPDLDLSIVWAIQACTQCKSFRPSRLNVLLQPITRWHPFKLLVGDYLSMPPGKGGYHTIGFYLDTFSQHMWAFKYKAAGTAKTTINMVSTVAKVYITPEMFMMDGGSYFNNTVV
jgi:hypothetical protein